MLFRKLAVAGTLATTLVFAGCATVGQDFATHNVDQLEVGETTRSQVQEMFGEPWRTGLKDGKRTWTYGKYRWSAFDDPQSGLAAYNSETGLGRDAYDWGVSQSGTPTASDPDVVTWTATTGSCTGFCI